MADTENDTADELDTEAEPAAGGGLKQKLILGGGAVLLLAIGLFAGPIVQNLMSPAGDASPAGDEAVAEEPAEPEVKEVVVKSDDPELYQGLHPAMVVNFRDAAGDQHFMQIEMEVMARNQKVIEAIKNHTPLIRNNLILLYGGVSYEAVTTREGKEQMLADGLREIQKVLTPRVGKPNVEALYFTSLIIQ
jgi:flagellar protein FliL